MSNEMERPEEAEARALVAKASVLENEARALKIIDNESYEIAGAMKNAIKAKREDILRIPLERKGQAHKVWTFMGDICKMIQRPYDNAEAILDTGMIAFRNRVAEQRRIEAAKAAEKARIDAEKKRKEEIARAKEIGDKEAARNLKAAPIQVAAVAPKTPEPPKISGIPTRKIWKYQIDVNKLDRKYMIPDDVKIGKLVRAMGAEHGISGVTAYQEEVQ